MCEEKTIHYLKTIDKNNPKGFENLRKAINNDAEFNKLKQVIATDLHNSIDKNLLKQEILLQKSIKKF